MQVFPGTTTKTWAAESLYFGPIHLHPGRHFAKDAKDDVENLYSILGLQKGKTLRLQTVKVSSDFKLLNRVDQFLFLSKCLFFLNFHPWGIGAALASCCFC